MTRKEINEFLANTKVYVNGKSKEIQEKLFSFGYEWRDVGTMVNNTDCPFLYIDENHYISFGCNMCVFTGHEYKKISAEEIISIELTEPTYRLFKDEEECWNEMLKHEPFGWVKRIDTGYFANIAMVSDCSIMFREGKEHFYDTALKEYTFADGTPFGIKED